MASLKKHDDWCYVNNYVLDAGGTEYPPDYYEEMLETYEISRWFFKEPIASNEFRCLLTKLSLWLDETSILTYINTALIVLILVISIFGKIKENYRWFIFNQALWDLVVVYRNWCFNEAGFFLGSGLHKDRLCPKQSRNADAITFFNIFWHDHPENETFFSLFLLAFSRFLCLYFPHFYERITKKCRIFIWLFGINAVIWLYIIFQNNIRLAFININFYSGPIVITYTKNWILILGSVFSVIMVIAKIARHLKFQVKHNKKDFYKGLRIAAVLFFQILFNSFIFSLEIINTIDVVLLYFGYTEYDYVNGGKDARIDKTIFWWMDERWGLASMHNFPLAKQIRIFLESILVLAIMAGYREAIARPFKWILKRGKTKTAVTPIQIFHTSVISNNN